MESPRNFERVEKIMKDIESILERSSDAAVQKLKSFIEIEPKDGQVYATLELFSDQNFCLSYNRFYVKEVDGKKMLDTEWDVTDASAESFIPKLEGYQTNLFGSATDYTPAEGNELGLRESQLLFEWFAKCWIRAGGEHSKTPTFFAMDKEYMCRDLVTGERFSEEEAARRLGHEVES